MASIAAKGNIAASADIRTVPGASQALAANKAAVAIQIQPNSPNAGTGRGLRLSDGAEPAGIVSDSPLA